MKPPNRDLRTRFAIQALDFSEAFNAGLGTLRLAPGEYRPELTSPEGPSTGGGVQATQHIRLVSARQGFSTLVVGSANQRSAQAELRSFDYVDAVHRERFGKPAPLDRRQYEQFLGMARNFFDTHRLTTTLAAPPPELVQRGGATGGGAPQGGISMMGVVIGVVVGLLAAGGVVYFVLR
jgi:hypothetical protein